jgi:hypothetical protein
MAGWTVAGVWLLCPGAEAVGWGFLCSRAEKASMALRDRPGSLLSQEELQDYCGLVTLI